MKKNNYVLLFIYICISFFTHHCLARTTSLIVPRSVSDNIARYLLGWEILIDQQRDHNYGVIAIIPEVSESFRQERIAQVLFGDIINERTTTFKVSGSLVRERASTEWLADYFGLPPDFESVVRVQPTVRNTLLDIGAYVGLHDYVPGLYVFIHGPLVYTKWDLNLCEAVIATGSKGYDPGYFSPQAVERDDLLNCFSQYLYGNTPTIENLTVQSLNFQRACNKSLRVIKVADIQAMAGYDWFASEYSHLASFLFFSVPTGNRPNGRYIFEPIAGNGHHGQIGFGITGHVQLCYNDVTCEEILLLGGFVFTHLTSAQQCRVFDLCNKHASRFMLATQLTTDITDNLVGQSGLQLKTPFTQFSGTVSPVTNLTASSVRCNIPWQFDSTLILSYRKGHLTWSLGYGIFARAAENIIRCKNAVLDDKNQYWALKGDAQVYGFTQDANETVPLSISMSRATINRAGNVRSTVGTTISTNPLIDNKALAFSDSGATLLLDQVGGTQINTSLNAKILRSPDIDLLSAVSSIFSQKIVGQITHTNIGGCTTIVPYFGFGAQVELGPRHGPTVPTDTHTIVNGALSTWSVWLKAGAAFES